MSISSVSFGLVLGAALVLLIQWIAKPQFQQPLYNWVGDEKIGTVTCMPYSFGLYREHRVPYGCRAWLAPKP